MSEDLARSLEGAGHSGVAQALRKKQLADELRSIDRQDLADALEGSTHTGWTDRQVPSRGRGISSGAPGQVEQRLDLRLMVKTKS